MSDTAEQPEQTEEQPKIDLLKVEITNENIALNVLVGFLGIAQRRGVFAINESAKIYEAIEKFKNTKTE